MVGFLMFVHAVIAVILVTAVLMQSGRGGGLTEAFSSAESMFGAQTSNFMIRMTTALAIVFFTSSLTLAIVSSKQEKSLLSNTRIAVPTDDETATDGSLADDLDQSLDAVVSDVQATMEDAATTVEAVANDVTTEALAVVEDVKDTAADVIDSSTNAIIAPTSTAPADQPQSPVTP